MVSQCRPQQSQIKILAVMQLGVFVNRVKSNQMKTISYLTYGLKHISSPPT